LSTNNNVFIQVIDENVKLSGTKEILQCIMCNIIWLDFLEKEANLIWHELPLWCFMHSIIVFSEGE
jgi:hypothetical protein